MSSPQGSNAKKMIEITTAPGSLAPAQRKELVEFLFVHLDQYGDSQPDIDRAIGYALGENGSPGGMILRYRHENELVGAVVFNNTGMSGYIPEHILVYIAVHGKMRGNGVGSQLMEKGLESIKGSIALHVEHNNPAKKLYEKMGFTNPYLEMRLKRK